MNLNQKTIRTQVIAQLSRKNEVEEEDIKRMVDFFSTLNPVTEIEKEDVIKDLQSKIFVKMDRGACIKDKDHVSWYYSAKSEIESKFWDRYSIYLQSDMGFNASVVDSLGASTDEMMDMLGNPKQSESFSRRGLVIGDVQSGKTATYTALVNKAADAGYRIVILLTGTIEKLRQQTQGRLDEGFIGLDSKAFLKNNADIKVGVGNIGPSIPCWAITSTSSDFNTSTATKFNGRLTDIDIPVLFVLKKNKSVLEKLEKWLRIYNVSGSDNKIHMPMLLIDDEADNASINTKKVEDDPSAINNCIRKLLDLFVKSSYVGFTATPFANIFINPETEKEMLEDLFPRDFIYCLEPPSNYVGARSIFNKNGKHNFMLKNNDDCEDHILIKHKKDFIFTSMPNSMKEAIASFFITNTIRDLRGQNKKHRSMLINVSIYIDVQKNMSDFIARYVRELQQEIKNYYLKGDEALQYPAFILLKRVYDKHFEPLKNMQFENEDMTFTWDDIQKSLYPSIAPIDVRYVNGGNAPKNLNYDDHEENGLRLIAVGGYSLSRGLTLEGLCISYFHRNSKMYDTLMQMGRWFGYRQGYESLCQIWLTEEAIEWYEYISEASDELRSDVRRMRDANLTPVDFGLAVRSDINTLLVTAVNKMRTANNYTVQIRLNGEMVETPYVLNDENINKKNYEQTKELIDTLLNDGYKVEEKGDLALKNIQILNVPSEYIVKFLKEYTKHHYNMEFNTDNIITLINQDESGVMKKWDIAIAAGEGDKINFCGNEIQCVSRIFAMKNNAIQLSGSKVRLGSTSLAKGGLTQDVAKKIELEAKERREKNNQKPSLTEKDYFISSYERNPLLVIYPITLKPTSKDSDGNNVEDLSKKDISSKFGDPIIGLSIGVPKIPGSESKTFEYKVNMVYYKELLGVDEDFSEIDDSIS